MKKIKKFINHPGIFFRDYLNKKHPIINNEQYIIQSEESIVIKNETELLKQDALIYPHSSVDIDVVFTWVDNQDINWQNNFMKHVNKNTTSSGLYANDQARFSNHNELFYSVQSVKYFMPWVRHIYVVTDNQTPDWLSPTDSKIKIIDHKEIIDNSFLPTFNSHVIEAHLHNISGLSEHFIYFNDDVFAARNLLTQHFFRSNGIASIFVAKKSLNAMRNKGVMTPTLSASLNSIKLLSKYYSAQIDAPLVHTYVPLRKSAYEKAWDIFNTEIKAFLHNKFRTNQDLNLATFLIPWLMYLDGQSFMAHEICYYFNIRSPHAESQYRALLQLKQSDSAPHSFCANDFNSQNQIDNYQEKLISALKQYFNFS
ncbi:stealth conserved region 3 domain-containing protein [Neisseria sp. 83E34]|uniref:stealth conserved region 3 domain-containing protein n=1 Tax=Neisseria sp. 83E34 TaxID=1692264 RepID=UPI0006CE9819|nr:stealth conserved region 3 domain-containing protein [Neisseria sp. 83E34]KPN71182.1 capsule biosynthesis protein CapC [Neisseria sp. 83E34]